MEKRFGDLLQELRKEKGWTQQQLADVLNVTNKTVSKWERNETYPETATLIEISKLFQISIDDLLNGRKTESEQSETVFVSNQSDLMTQWSITKAELFSKCTAVLGLSGFYGIYFLTKTFVPSFLLLSCFLLVSFAFVLFKREKIKVFTGKKSTLKDYAEWVGLVLAMILLVIPCINFPVELSSLELFETVWTQGMLPDFYQNNGQLYITTHLSFLNYLTWFPYLLSLAFLMYHGVIAFTEKRLTIPFKKSFVLAVCLVVLVYAGNIMQNSFRPYETMSEKTYQAYKNRYVTIAEAFDKLPDNLSVIDSSVLDQQLKGKARYKMYMNVAGFDDDTQKVYYAQSLETQKTWRVGRTVAAWVLSCLGIVWINKRKEV